MVIKVEDTKTEKEYLSSSFCEAFIYHLRNMYENTNAFWIRPIHECFLWILFYQKITLKTNVVKIKIITCFLKVKKLGIVL